MHTPAWHPKPLVMANLAGAGLLLSWLWPATRAGWEAVDQGLFRLLNGSLSSGEGWQVLWAVANWRPFDLVAGLIILFTALHWCRHHQVEEVKTRMATFFMFAVWLVVASLVFQLVLRGLEYRRLSPTLVMEGAIRLSDIITFVEAKDSSSTAFPGDHAFVLFSAIAFFWIHDGPRRGLFSALTLLPFAVPRLVSGAHWLTDIVVGGLFLCLLAVSWWFASPLGKTLTAASLRGLSLPLSWVAGPLTRKEG